MMIKENVMECYLEALINGNRKACRQVIEDVLRSGITVNSVYAEVIWPIMVEVEKLHRAGSINCTQEHLATRINRTIIDQLQNKLPKRESKNKKIIISCAEEQLQELGAQIMADLFESDGWEVKFVGGGLTNDDLLAFVNEYGPDILMIYGTTPKQAPSIRKLIDKVRSVNAWPDMKIMVSGGLFNRAEGLWQEIGADLYAATAVEAVQAASDTNSDESLELKTIKRKKRTNNPE